MSARYILDRKLPDKAIDVIVESGSALMLLPESRRKKTIGLKEIETTIATMARIPPKTVSKDDAVVLQHLDQTLKQVVYGQDKAIAALSSSIKLARAGLREPEKPIGCYLFSGPTGVGKTEVAKQLSIALGVEMIRFDMSEYMERHTVSRLIGAPPGYVGFDQGGLLTDGVDQHPHCVLLLDEVEKAHPDLFNVLLQIMDHGKLTDHNGKQVDFRNVILIMTTNAGAADLARQAYGFTRIKREGDDVEAINRLFAPEFRNRLDAIITFAHLTPEIIAKVVEKFVLQLEAQLGDRDVTIELSEEATKWLINHGYDEQMGARPMARLIQENIKKALADEVLFGKLKTGGHVRVIAAKDEETGAEKLAFEYLEGPITPKPEKIPEAKPKRRSPRRKPSGPKGSGGPPSPRGSVPKVPLVKV
jgi:ATP-dependent Clp protease ATP-binding subunit ClpA